MAAKFLNPASTVWANPLIKVWGELGVPPLISILLGPIPTDVLRALNLYKSPLPGVVDP